MADINQLIEPITPSNTVNSINIYKVDYSDFWSASASYLPNVFVNPRKIKGKKLNESYIQTNPKIGQLKIKQFVSPILKSHWGLVSKAVKIKNTISLNTENDKLMFVRNASKEDLKKIKYDNYFGIRVSDTDLFDFDRRMVYHDIQRDPNDDDVVIIDRNNAEPMLDLSKYKNVFIDKNTYKPITSYYIKEYYDNDTPEFVGKQQEGVTGSIILPNKGVTGSIILPNNDSNVNQEDSLTNKEDSLTNKEDQQKTFFQRLAEKEKITLKDLKDARIQLEKEKRRIEKDLKKTILRYIDKYVNFAAASELNNSEDIDYIIDVFNEYAQDENIKINKRSVDAVNRRIDKLRDFESTFSDWFKVPTDYWDKHNLI